MGTTWTKVLADTVQTPSLTLCLWRGIASEFLYASEEKPLSEKPELDPILALLAIKYINGSSEPVYSPCYII